MKTLCCDGRGGVGAGDCKKGKSWALNRVLFADESAGISVTGWTTWDLCVACGVCILAVLHIGSISWFVPEELFRRLFLVGLRVGVSIGNETIGACIMSGWIEGICASSS